VNRQRSLIIAVQQQKSTGTPTMFDQDKSNAAAAKRSSVAADTPSTITERVGGMGQLARGAGAPQGARGRANGWVKVSVGALTALLVIGSLVAWRASSAKKEEPKKDADKIFEFAKRDLADFGPRDLGNVIPLSGSVKPLTQAVVKTKVAAEVAKVHVREGERVAAGQVLVSLDTADLKARADAQAATVAEMKARLDLASKNEANNRALLQKNFISQNAFDAVSNTVAVAQANLKSAEAQSAIVARALSDASIRAPFGGIVARRMVNIGEKLSPDMAVMQIVDLSQMELEAAVPVAEIPGIKVGQEISFTVDGFADRQFKGKVERINPSAEAGSRSISVFLVIANQDGALKGGMFANGKLAAQSRGAVNAVPLVSLREEGGQSFVYVIEKDKIERKSVTPGTRNIDLGLVEIRDGLTQGTQVVAVKMEGLKPGAKAILRAEGAAKDASNKNNSGADAAAANKSAATK
jgi:membrane fusion protein, multidrug efflux system